MRISATSKKHKPTRANIKVLLRVSPLPLPSERSPERLTRPAIMVPSAAMKVAIMTYANQWSIMRGTVRGLVGFVKPC